ncbi:dephospho-CoA kinase [Congregibacter variabilis]|uniref:Dephospho-CoA kinase n=1 Tax=Congregibacter variabilis TaxID=3081200 RepID=A0ABZ0I5Z6_9GAMM|nr:dephospho-CoA kinase [Congregibacter sp. IMCC43200]
MSKALRVGITGGIGSGKSAVTERLQSRGIEVVDADIVAREVVEAGSSALEKIAQHFGKEVISADGNLDRAALRRIVFSDPDQRLWLERLTHPLIGESIAQQLATAASSYAVLSSPLLLESSQRDFVDHIVVVDVPESVQISRTKARDNNSEELVRAIMAAQMSRDSRLAAADTVIDNSGALAELDQQVTALHEKLLRLSAAR